MSERIAIFGAGLSGLAAQRLALSLGYEVCLFDEAGQGDSTCFGQTHAAEYDAYVFSPGFAAQHPWRRIAETSGRPCYGELGFAASHWRGKLLGVTGTNGKTTGTALLRSALEEAGKPAFEAGNIGHPLSDWVLDTANTSEAWAVCEISSFQAEMPLGLKLDGLLWTNFAEDHLDRYSSMADYFAAKARLFECLEPGAPCVLGPEVREWARAMAVVVPAQSRVIPGADLSSSIRPDSAFRQMPQRKNLTLLAELWGRLGFEAASLLNSAEAFQLAPHRLSKIAEWGQVGFWDDSKATNFHAALAACEAMDNPVFWIGGGRGKGGDIEAFAHAVALRVQGAFLYGEVADQLARSLRPVLRQVEVHPFFSQAVEAAARSALSHSPATVLLSPGFASFDQFSSYSERGKTFVSIVLSLKDAVLAN